MGSANLDQMNDYERTGIIAGRGTLPLTIARTLRKSNKSPFVILLKGEADPEEYADFKYEIVSITKVGKILTYLKENDCKNLVLAGPVNRPNFRNIIPDFEGFKLLKRITTGNHQGDNALLSTITAYLAEKGFNIMGAHEFDVLLTADVGNHADTFPSEEELIDISNAVNVLKSIGELDIGQALTYRDGYVLAVEAAEGTHQMITRCGQFKRDTAAGFLLKMSKPDQNLSVDMPTIGVDTVISVHEAGLRGIVFEAARTLILDKELAIAEANTRNVFLYGVSCD